MAYAEKKDLKLFYTIGEVAEMFDVKDTLLRFWEREFPQINPKKGGRGVRRYTKDDIEIIRVIYNLVKVRGLRIDAAREVLRKNHEGTVKTTEVVDRLRALRAELVELKAEMGAM
ncbi:MAG: MerR family transcriptional regulator [Alloprevotella sp.]|jgi:putative transcriptional regulator|uniref:MerR family transcriptional regulator n=1 Tax=Alloprevotella sp. Lung230 TaxID=2766595 RepID=UPI0016563892|nr:MerR family transcriptional regulator [Alloprevotella sp. Lung230]MBC8625862.1 MerR family transcriptional regulator [Alloprevotella sp. Lung230]